MKAQFFRHCFGLGTIVVNPMERYSGLEPSQTRIRSDDEEDGMDGRYREAAVSAVNHSRGIVILLATTHVWYIGLASFHLATSSSIPITPIAQLSLAFAFTVTSLRSLSSISSGFVFGSARSSQL
jgi:hypothetical protein